MDTDITIEEFLARPRLWPEEIAALREILLAQGLTEDIKWGKPTYLADGVNIAIIQEFKDALALMFFKGALLKSDLLIDQGPNSRSARRLEFRSAEQVNSEREIIADLVAQAKEVERAGLSVPPAPEPELCDELTEALASDPELASGWESLTPGRRREYHLHIASAKQSTTRASRVAKFADKIRAGKGMRDR